MTQGMNPDQFERMLEDPNFLQQMNEMMDSPTFQQMMLDNPMFRDNPMARQLIRDPAYRRILMNPQFMLEQMRAQQRAESASARGNFPAPGATDNTAETAGQNAAGQGQGAAGQAANPFAQLGGSQMANTNSPPGASAGTPGGVPPLNSLLSSLPPDFFRQMGAADGQGNPSGAAGGAAGGLPDGDFLAATMRLMQNPDFQTLARGMPGGIPGMPGADAGAAPGANPFADLYGGMGGLGGLGGMAPPPQENPADTRPPEERYADQLRQLNDMGFFDFDQNIQALRRSGGSVQGAVEYLLSNP
jgi:ubiquilin